MYRLIILIVKYSSLDIFFNNFSPSFRNLFLHLPKDSDPDDTKCPRVCQVPSSPSVEWPFAQEDCTGLESLPFRLMMQDCTSVKTLLLKMKRILQEVMTSLSMRFITFSVSGLVYGIIEKKWESSEEEENLISCL